MISRRGKASMKGGKKRSRISNYGRNLPLFPIFVLYQGVMWDLKKVWISWYIRDPLFPPKKRNPIGEPFKFECPLAKTDYVFISISSIVFKWSIWMRRRISIARNPDSKSPKSWTFILSLYLNIHSITKFQRV